MKLCNIDYTGDKVYKLNIRDIIQCFGATLDSRGRIGFEEDDPILDEYPHIYVNDGMGYSDFDLLPTLVYREGDGHFVIWGDEEDEKLIKEYEKDKKVL